MGLTEELPSWIRKYFKPDSTGNYGEIQKHLRLADGAKFRERIKLNPGSVKVPATKPADYATHGINGAWEFSDSADDRVVGVFVQPTNIDNAIEIRIMWSSAATSGDCVWQLEYLYRKNGEDTTASAQGTLTSTDTTISTANGLQETNFTGIANPDDASKYLLFRLQRTGTNGNDTISNTVELTGITYEYISDRLGADV